MGVVVHKLVQKIIQPRYFQPEDFADLHTVKLCFCLSPAPIGLGMDNMIDRVLFYYCFILCSVVVPTCLPAQDKFLDCNQQQTSDKDHNKLNCIFPKQYE